MTLDTHEDLWWIHQASQLDFQFRFLPEVTVTTNNSIQRSAKRYLNAGAIWLRKVEEIDRSLARRIAYRHLPKAIAYQGQFRLSKFKLGYELDLKPHLGDCVYLIFFSFVSFFRFAIIKFRLCLPLKKSTKINRAIKRKGIK